MNNVELVRRKQRLDSLFKKASTLGADPELLSHWARYLCVLVSGFIEGSLKTILGKFAEDRSHEFVSNFVESQLEYLQNPKTDKIFEVVGRFNPIWRTEIEKALDDRLMSAINSVVGNRNQIAHGNDVGLSFVRLVEYYKAVVEAIELIEIECS